MIKRTLYFVNPAYLKLELDQLRVGAPNGDIIGSVPIEDIGIVILDNPQITITHGLIRKLQDFKVAIISCDQSHMPKGLLLPLEGNYTQTEVQRYQIEASNPLKKQLWQQTIKSKIRNQKAVLQRLGKPFKKLEVLERRVNSGDSDNVEGQAAAYYWKMLFDDFNRDRFGESPNNFLNFGYAILRSMVARSLVSSGLLPTLGIFHKNKYNAFGLADDIMEPFRPFVDFIVYNYINQPDAEDELNNQVKSKLLSIATMDALFSNKKFPLMVGMSLTSKSLADCYQGAKRRIIYPTLP